jgi:hypothetical protein
VPRIRTSEEFYSYWGLWGSRLWCCRPDRLDLRMVGDSDADCSVASTLPVPRGCCSG